MTQNNWVSVTFFVHFKFAYFQTLCLQCRESTSQRALKALGHNITYLWFIRQLFIMCSIFTSDQLQDVVSGQKDPGNLSSSSSYKKKTSSYGPTNIWNYSMFNDLDVIWVLVWEGETPSTNSLSQLETKDDSSLSDCQQPTVILRTTAEFSAVKPLHRSVAGLNNLTQINRLQLSTLSFGWPLVSQCSAMPDQKPTGSSAKKRKDKKTCRSLGLAQSSTIYRR